MPFIQFTAFFTGIFCQTDQYTFLSIIFNQDLMQKVDFKLFDTLNHCQPNLLFHQIYNLTGLERLYFINIFKQIAKQQSDIRQLEVINQKFNFGMLDVLIECGLQFQNRFLIFEHLNQKIFGVVVEFCIFSCVFFLPGFRPIEIFAEGECILVHIVFRFIHNIFTIISYSLWISLIFARHFPFIILRRLVLQFSFSNLLRLKHSVAQAAH